MAGRLHAADRRAALRRPGCRGLLFALGQVEERQRRRVDAFEIAGQLRGGRCGRQRRVEAVRLLAGGDLLLVGGDLAGIVAGNSEQRAPVQRLEVDARLAVGPEPSDLGLGATDSGRLVAEPKPELVAPLYEVAYELDTQRDAAKGFLIGDNRPRIHWLMPPYARTTAAHGIKHLLASAHLGGDD